MDGPWVVTGVGIASAAGDSSAALLAALNERRPLTSVRPGDGLPVAAMQAFDATRYIRRKGVKDLSRTSQLACAAAAGNSAGLLGVPVEEVGVVLGSAWGSLATVIDFEREAHVQGPRFVDPILFTETVSNVPAGQVAILYGWSAFNATVSAGSASGTAGLQRALEFLHEGRGAVAVAGGADELNVPVLKALAARRLVADRLDSLPLAENRCGPIGGEGCCFVTLESVAHAAKRGAPALAQVRAAVNRFSPRTASGNAAGSASLSGLIRELLQAAGLQPGDVDLIVLSASGTRTGDLEESGAVIDVFGAGAPAPPVLLPKAILGETWGASGAFAAAAAIEIMRASLIPGAPAELVLAAEARGLNIPAESTERPVQTVMILDGASAGHQLGLVLSAVEH